MAIVIVQFAWGYIPYRGFKKSFYESRHRAYLKYSENERHVISTRGTYPGIVVVDGRAVYKGNLDSLHPNSFAVTNEGGPMVVIEGVRPANYGKSAVYASGVVDYWAQDFQYQHGQLALLHECDDVYGYHIVCQLKFHNHVGERTYMQIMYHPEISLDGKFAAYNVCQAKMRTDWFSPGINYAQIERPDGCGIVIQDDKGYMSELFPTGANLYVAELKWNTESNLLQINAISPTGSFPSVSGAMTCQQGAHSCHGN